jgi:hypothetical protein
VRMRGEGVFADQIEALFDASVRKIGLNEERYQISGAHFRKPDTSPQLKLFQ